MEGALGRHNSPSLTRRWGIGPRLLERSRALGHGGDRGATESVRGRSPASHAVDNAAARWHRPEMSGRLPAPSLRKEERRRGGRADRSWWPRRQARTTRGRIVARRSGAAGRRTGRKLRAEAGGQRGASHALGNQAIHGCSCRESVAEVGEEHLPRITEGSREASRGRREVARSGGFDPDRAEPTPRRVKGCEAEGRERQVSVTTHPSIARSGTEPVEGVLDQ
jgi:hypothetical protein